MSITEFDKELYDRCRLREGYNEGLEQGAHNKAIETAKNFLQMKLGNIEQISKGTGLPLEEIQKLAVEIS